MQATTGLKIIEARKEHVPFIAWVELTAARSHLERSTWDFYIDGPEAECLEFLETLAATDAWHFGHYSNFLVAEVDGQPAAALSGYFEEECGMPALLGGMAEANRKLARSAEQDAAGWQRAGSLGLCMPEHVERAWIVEWVATSPDFRRRGLVDRLLAEILDLGRAKGAATADIGVFIDNDPAQAAYEKAGFAVIDEKRHPDFEAVYKSPGVRLLRRGI